MIHNARHVWFAALLVCAALIFGACGDSAGSDATPTSTSPGNPTATATPDGGTPSPASTDTPSAKTGLPQVFLLDPQSLADTRARVEAHDPALTAPLHDLLARADKALKTRLVSVMEKAELPPSGDKHDYLSLSIYSWPDPTKPDGLPYITRDGKVNPEAKSIPDAADLVTMITTVHTLALAYYFTGDETYAARAMLQLRTWFINSETRMNPNLTYAQIVRGRDTTSGGGIIDSRNLVEVVDAIGLLEQSPSWQPGDAAGLRDWFSRYLDWLLTSPNGQSEDKAVNNHASFYDGQVVSIALYLKRDELARQVVQASLQKRIVGQIEPDGRQPYELARTNAWSYSVFNLEALFNLAYLGNNLNISLSRFQSDDGRSLHKALDFLLPYARGQKPWPYSEIDPFTAKPLTDPLLQASVLYNDTTYRDVARTIQGNAALDAAWLNFGT